MRKNDRRWAKLYRFLYGDTISLKVTNQILNL